MVRRRARRTALGRFLKSGRRTAPRTRVTAAAAVRPRRRSLRRSPRRVASRRKGNRGFMGSGKVIDVLAVVAGGLAGWFAPRKHDMQDPAIFTAAAALGTGILPTPGALKYAGGLANGYVLGTLALGYFGTKIASRAEEVKFKSKVEICATDPSGLCWVGRKD